MHRPKLILLDEPTAGVDPESREQILNIIGGLRDSGSAILYTIIVSCRRRGVEPYAYLRDVLTRLPRMTNWQIKDVTPEAWVKSPGRSPLQAAS